MCKYPRILASTRPPAPRAVKLPPLLTAVCYDGDVQQVVQTPDPRAELIRKLTSQAGVVAYAVTSEAEVVSPVRRGRKAGGQ